jgi:hypothetical protein
MWVWLFDPAQVFGEIQKAAAMPASHWMTIKAANMRSVRSKIDRRCSAKRSFTRR